MKNLKLVLFSIITLTLILAAGLPAMAATSDTKISGILPLMAFHIEISDVTYNAAAISWKTNGNATSQVFYDIEAHEDVTGYAYQSILDSNPVTNHRVGLNQLLPSTTYHYRVESVSAESGSEFGAISENLSFITSEGIAPRVTSLGALSLSPTSAVLCGILDNPDSASSVEVYFEWGKTKDYGFETEHQAMSSAPRIILDLVNSLSPDTTYHFRIVAKGAGVCYGQDKVFKTSPLPAITVVTPNGGENWAAGTHHTITWTYINVGGKVKIELLKDGVLSSEISKSTSIGRAGRGSFEWTVPKSLAAGSGFTIRVTSLTEPDCTDPSDNYFTITRR